MSSGSVSLTLSVRNGWTLAEVRSDFEVLFMLLQRRVGLEDGQPAGWGMVAAALRCVIVLHLALRLRKGEFIE